METGSKKQIQPNILENKLTKAWPSQQVNHVAVKLNKAKTLLTKL